jgi:hypothetical protein
MTRDYCRAAYLCLRKSATNIDFSKLNVSVYIPQQIPEGECNFVGVAVYAAIASAIMKDATFDAHSAFIGGVDFYSNMFLDAYDVTPYLYALAEHGIRTVYAPLGSSQLIYGPYPGGIEIVESGNIETLLSTAVSNSTI